METTAQELLDFIKDDPRLTVKFHEWRKTHRPKHLDRAQQPFTVPQVAEYFRVGGQTVRKWANKAGLSKKGWEWRFTADEVEQMTTYRI